MPWQEVSPMDQRVFFITDYLRQTTSISGLFSISLTKKKRVLATEIIDALTL